MEVALGAVGPGDPAGLHAVGGVEVVPLAVYLLAPALRNARVRVEVVLHAAEAAPAGEGRGVPRGVGVEVALGAVGPGDPALLHDALAVEVVPLAVDPLAPALGHARGRVEVVLHAAEAAPTGQGLPVPVEVALGSVSPGDPAPLHDAGAVEVVPGAADLLGPLNRLPVGAVVVGLASNRLPNIAVDFDN